jgi:hypothetical protein
MSRGPLAATIAGSTRRRVEREIENFIAALFEEYYPT